MDENGAASDESSDISDDIEIISSFGNTSIASGTSSGGHTPGKPGVEESRNQKSPQLLPTFSGNDGDNGLAPQPAKRSVNVRSR